MKSDSDALKEFLLNQWPCLPLTQLTTPTGIYRVIIMFEIHTNNKISICPQWAHKLFFIFFFLAVASIFLFVFLIVVVCGALCVHVENVEKTVATTAAVSPGESHYNRISQCWRRWSTPNTHTHSQNTQQVAQPKKYTFRIQYFSKQLLFCALFGGENESSWTENLCELYCCLNSLAKWWFLFIHPSIYPFISILNCFICIFAIVV